jgi:hypothetical protein
MSLIVVLSIIFIHWVADFIFQAEEWANNKSKSLKPLLKHTITYSFIWYVVMVSISVWGNHFGGPSIKELGWSPWMGLFPVITFVFHTITDYFTSKIVSKRFVDQYYGSPIPNFGAFTIIGFDQVLHYTHLFLTYYLLTK